MVTPSLADAPCARLSRFIPMMKALTGRDGSPNNGSKRHNGLPPSIAELSLRVASRENTPRARRPLLNSGDDEKSIALQDAQLSLSWRDTAESLRLRPRASDWPPKQEVDMIFSCIRVRCNLLFISIWSFSTESARRRQSSSNPIVTQTSFYARQFFHVFSVSLANWHFRSPLVSEIVRGNVAAKCND
jgi:hypothetical protein